MDDPPAVGIRHRVADVEEMGKELAQGQGPFAARALVLRKRSIASLRLSPRMNRIA